MRRAPDQRVLDLLTESTSDFVNLDDVKVFSSFDRKNCLTTLPAMVVPKNRLQMVIIPTDRFEVSRKHRIHKIAKKIQLETTTIVAGNLVQGTLHLKNSANNAQHILSDLLGHFFAITTATIHVPGSELVKAATVLANKDFVSTISCGEAEPESAAHPTANLAATTPRRLDDSIAGQLLVDGL
jgi:hypothetical protein